MKFKIDENLPTELAEVLRAEGHQAETVEDESLVGASDRCLLEQVKVEAAVFLTMDKGVADVRIHPPSEFEGIVLLRPASTGRCSVLSFMRRHLPALLHTPLRGRLVVISESGIRARS